MAVTLLIAAALSSLLIARARSVAAAAPARMRPPAPAGDR
jgi:hypothetical protein